MGIFEIPRESRSKSKNNNKRTTLKSKRANAIAITLDGPASRNKLRERRAKKKRKNPTEHRRHHRQFRKQYQGERAHTKLNYRAVLLYIFFLNSVLSVTVFNFSFSFSLVRFQPLQMEIEGWAIRGWPRSGKRASLPCFPASGKACTTDKLVCVRS